MSHDSHTNYRFLSSAEKDERLHNLEMAKVTERKRNKRLSEKLHDLVEKEGVHLTEEDEADISSIFSGVEVFKEGSI